MITIKKINTVLQKIDFIATHSINKCSDIDEISTLLSICYSGRVLLLQFKMTLVDGEDLPELSSTAFKHVADWTESKLEEFENGDDK